MHCEKIDIWAQHYRKYSRGLSVTTFRNCEYFFESTPKMSPPTVATATPTDVQTLTRRYGRAHLNSMPMGGKFPGSWLHARTQDPPDPRSLIEVRSENVVMLDGDSGHLLIAETDPHYPQLNSMITHRGRHHDTMRFRTRSHDAPELETAFRCYAEGGRGVRPVDTVHCGVESLRLARRTIAQARHVYLNIPGKTSCRGCSGPVTMDRHNRYLLDIWVQCEGETPLRLLPEILADAGQTVPILTEGVDRRIYRAARNARKNRSGLFRLPKETRQFPCRPWDLRKKENLALAQGSQHPCNLDDVDAPVRSFRVIPSQYATEGYTYPAPSTIQGAGYGLFLRPRYHTIKAGDYLCTYAETFTARKPADAEGAGSYLLEVVHKGRLRFYNSPTYDGTNIGRFANQREVIRSLNEAREMADARNFPEMRDEDWKKINERSAEQANARYIVSGEKLHVVASRDFGPDANPVEIFTTYGDVRSFWITAIVRNPGDFSPEMVEPIRFLFNSPYSNLSAAQKVSWGDCEDLIGLDGKVSTLGDA